MVYLTKIDAARNMARFYALDLQPGPVRRLGARPALGPDRAGQIRSTLYEKQEGAAATLERELRRRKRRGYA